MDCSPPGSSCLWGFSRQEYWSGLPCPPPGDLPNPGRLNPGLLHYRQNLYCLSYREAQWWWRADSSSVPWGYPLTQIRSLFLHCSTPLCLQLNPQKGQILWRVSSFLLRKWLRHCTHHFLCRMLIFCTFSDSRIVRPLCDSWLVDWPWPPVAWVGSGRVAVPFGLISLLLWKSWAFCLTPMGEFYGLNRCNFLASSD